jgi:hypothetical protein
LTDQWRPEQRPDQPAFPVRDFRGRIRALPRLSHLSRVRGTDRLDRGCNPNRLSLRESLRLRTAALAATDRDAPRLGSGGDSARMGRISGGISMTLWHLTEQKAAMEHRRFNTSRVNASTTPATPGALHGHGHGFIARSTRISRQKLVDGRVNPCGRTAGGRGDSRESRRPRC